MLTGARTDAAGDGGGVRPTRSARLAVGWRVPATRRLRRFAESRVVRVIDGDTVVLRTDGREETVRLIGIDTPEVRESEKLERDVRRQGRDRATIQAMGARATKYTQERVLARSVFVERDVRLRDRYGRSLAYLWLADGRLLNAEIVREGYAVAMTVPPNVKYAAHFVALEREARASRRGSGSDEQVP
jgi:micrococcal nuclease